MVSRIQTFKSKVASIATWCIFVSNSQSNKSSSLCFPLHLTVPKNLCYFTCRDSSSKSGGVGRDGISSIIKKSPQIKNVIHHNFRSKHDKSNTGEIGLSCLLATSPIRQELTSAKVRTCLEEGERKGNDRRCYNTEADIYFKKHGKIPQPIIIHDKIEQMMKNDQRISGDNTCCSPRTLTGQNDNDDTNGSSSKILIIGDIHGCLNELKLLVKKAQKKNNDNQPFKCIILVGDLCNKGPNSAEVIKYIRKQRHWFTVRGNHDDGALAAALGDLKRRSQPNYAWIFPGDKNVAHGDERNKSNHNNKLSSLSDEDIKWLSNVPYTITIPKSFWRYENQDKDNFHYQDDDNDVIIVHAGFIPNIPLESQDIKTMVTIRDVVSTIDCQNDRSEDERLKRKNYKYFEGNKHSSSSNSHVSQDYQEVQPWAKAWSGPQLVVFGHDAKRGLQLEKCAIGLDTGCTYGKELSAVVLPDKDIVSVRAEMIHCPIVEK